MTRNKNEPCTTKAQSRENNLLAIGRLENNEDGFPLNILIVQKLQQKELRNTKSNISTYISDQGSSYSMEELDGEDIICYDTKIYVPQSMRRRVLDWYHFYLNHPGGSRLTKTTRKVCY